MNLERAAGVLLILLPLAFNAFFFLLARRRVPGALWWAIANPPAWALGWLVTSYVISTNVDEQFTNFGASGALVYGLLTWLLLAALLRAAAPEVRETADR